MNPDTFVPRRRWRVAVVGAGYFSQFHLQAWAGMPDVDIVGLCDTDPARAEALGQRFGIPERYTQAQAMLDRFSATNDGPPIEDPVRQCV